MSSGSNCSIPSKYVTVAFALDTCVTGLFVILGVVGNLLTILAFGTYRPKTSTTILLTGLAVSDLLYLSVHAFLFQVLRSIYPETGYFEVYHDYWNWIEPYEYPCGVMLQTVSVWCVVLVAFDRFIAIRWPLKSMHLCTTRRATFELLGVVVFAILLNLPRFFTQKTVMAYDSCRNTTVAKLVGTDFGWSPAYIWPATVLYIGFIYAVPIVVLIIVNSSLMVALRAAGKNKRRLTIVGIHIQKSNQEGERITFMLILVVMVFILCQIPVGIDHILYATKMKSWPWPERGYYSLVCNALVALNSSANFYIYALFGSKFRRRLNDLCCCMRRKFRSTSTNFQLSLVYASPISVKNSMVLRENPTQEVVQEPLKTV